MPSKVQLYAQMADRTAEQITGSYQKWTAFLTTAARLYKYPYNEQLMIFAQRPEATACAGYDLWNKQMRRYVRRGSKGIALVDTSSDQPKLRYVFDVSDTSGGENSRRPYLWEYRQEHREVVSAALEQRFDVSGENGLADQMERVAAQLVDEYWHDNWRDIVGIVDGSFLEDYDEFNIGAAFRNAAVVSTTYALLSRCGMQPGDYFEHEDFLNVFDFNTPQTVAALGTAISQSSELVLRQIEVTIKNYEREKIAERSESHERTDLHRSGDYLIPDLSLTEQPQVPLGKYGRMRKDYLKEHRPVLWNSLLLSERLYPHLREIDEAANNRLEQMMPELMKSAGVTEALKASDPMKWVGLMNTLKAQAEETILTELVFS